MSDFKSFGQKGVGNDVQLGRRGPRVVVSSGNILFRNSANSAYTNVEVADPVTADQAATKRYVDAIATGLDIKASVRVATTAALANSPTYANGSGGMGATLTAGSNGAFPAVDGVTLVLNDRILVKNQVTAAHNGIYTLSTVGDGSNPYVLTRAIDADTAVEVTPGLFTFVEEGTLNSDKGFVLTTDNPITIGTTDLNFTQFSSSGSADPLYRQATFNYNTSSPFNISAALPTNAIIQRVKLNIVTPWDDAAATVAIDNTATTFMPTGSNDLLDSGQTFLEEMLGSTQVSANNQLRAVISSGSATQGQSIAHIEYLLS